MSRQPVSPSPLHGVAALSWMAPVLDSAPVTRESWGLSRPVCLTRPLSRAAGGPFPGGSVRLPVCHQSKRVAVGSVSVSAALSSAAGFLAP